MTTKRKARLAASTVAQIAGAIATELRRLNRARLDSTVLASMTPRDRRNAVKAALATHHRNTSRCC
jgi:hypothetical protein